MRSGYLRKRTNKSLILLKNEKYWNSQFIPEYNALYSKLLSIREHGDREWVSNGRG
jgi:hypothetical protein